MDQSLKQNKSINDIDGEVVIELTKKEWTALIATGLLSGCSGYYGGYLLSGKTLGYLSWASNSLANSIGLYNLIQDKKESREQNPSANSKTKISLFKFINWILSLGSAAAGGVFA